MDLEHRVKALEQEVKILKNQVQHTLLEIEEQVLTHYHSSLRADDPVEEPELEAEPAAAPKAVPSGPLVAAKVTPFGPSLNVAGEVAGEDAEWVAFPELVDWAGTSVQTIGAERTVKLLEMHTRSGAIASEIRDALLELIALSGDEGAPEKVGMKEMTSSLLKLNHILGIKAGAGAVTLRESGLG